MLSKQMAQQLTWQAYEEAGLTYCYLITHEANSDSPKDVPPLEPVDGLYYGPRDASDEAVATAKTKGQPWRVLDDDGTVCAKGRMWASDAEDDWTDSDAAFAPLDDYGEGMFGATQLQYRKDGQWVTL